MLKFVNAYFILDRPDLAMFQRGQERIIDQLVVVRRLAVRPPTPCGPRAG